MDSPLEGLACSSGHGECSRVFSVAEVVWNSGHMRGTDMAFRPYEWTYVPPF